MLDKVKKTISFLENSLKGGLTLWIVSFFSVIIARLIIEGFLFGFKNQTFEEFVICFLHTFLFFLLTYLVFLIYIHFTIGNDFKKTASILLWGFWIIIFPPIIDKIYFKDRMFFDFYLFDGVRGLFEKFISFFGDNISIGITLGPRIQVVLVLILLGFYFFYYKRSWFKTVFFVFGAYCLFFILASIPSIIVLIGTIFGEKNVLEITYNEVSAMFLSPLRYFSHEGVSFISFMGYKLSFFYIILLFIIISLMQYFINKEKFLAILKNIRYPQMIFNFGLFFIGMSLGAFYFPEYFKLGFFPILAVLNLLIAILFIWLFSVVVNDIFDLNIDKMTNQKRPLVKGVFSEKEYWELGFIFLLIAFISSLLIGSKFFIIIIVYTILTWVYSSPPFRLKKFFPISLIIASFSSLLFLIMGYILISKEQSLVEFPWRIFWFLFIAYCLIIPIKDLKDIESDRRFGIKTLPVLFGEKNTRFILAVLVFFCYTFSIYVISEKELLIPAVLFGGISFWKIVNKKIPTSCLNWWLLGLVSVYGLFIISFMFL